MADRFENVINLTRLTDFYNKLVSKFFSKVVTTEAVKYSNNSKTTITFASALGDKIENSLIGTDATKVLSARMGKQLQDSKLSASDIKVVSWVASNYPTYTGNKLTAVWFPIEIEGWEPVAIAGYSTACPNAFPLDIHFESNRTKVVMNIKLQQSSNYKLNSSCSVSVMYIKNGSITAYSGSSTTTTSVKTSAESKSITVTV